jgi:hypothetical protein
LLCQKGAKGYVLFFSSIEAGEEFMGEDTEFAVVETIKE